MNPNVAAIQRTRYGGRCRTMIGPRALPIKSPPASGATAAHSTGPVAMNTAAATSEVTPEKHILDRIGGRDTRGHQDGPRLDEFTARAEGRAWADRHARDQIGDAGRQRRNPDGGEGRVRHQRRDATSTSDDSRHDSGRQTANLRLRRPATHEKPGMTESSQRQLKRLSGIR
jgi:hypothetical protein